MNPSNNRSTRSARSRGLLLPAPNPAVHSPLYNAKPWNTYSIALISWANLPSWAVRKGTSGGECPTFGALNASGEKSLPGFAAAAAAAFRSDYGNQRKRYYQVTWEPAVDWCFRGSAAELVKIYSLVCAAIHAADPGAVVAGPTLFPDAASTAQLRELWQAGLRRYIDALSIHPYVHWPPESTGALLPTLRLQLSEASRAVGHPVPFIGTEHGYPSVSLGNLNKALGDIRALTAGTPRAAPPKRVTGITGILTPGSAGEQTSLPPMASCPRAAMTRFLDGTVSDGPARDLGASQFGYQFHRQSGMAIRAVWDPQGNSTYPVGAGSRVCDWMGNCAAPAASNAMVNIGQTPTYIIDER